MWALAWFLLLAQSADFNEQGRKALEAQKYAEAAQYFTEAVQADASDFTAHFHLALADSFLKKDAEAIAEYKKVLELKPGLYQAELNLGILLIRNKQGNEAVPYLERSVAAKPKEFRPRLYFGEALLAAGDAARAEEQFKAALELDPKQAPAELGLAHAIARQKRLDEAAPHFRKAAELDPAYRDALLELAALYEADQRAVEAIEIYQQFPEDAAAQERLGALLIATKRYREAIPLFEKLTASSPSTANRLALAQAYLFSGETEKALPLLEQSVTAEPENYDLHMMYGRALRDRKQALPAAQQFQQALRLKPDSREAWNEIAGMLYLLGDFPKALAALDRARTLGEETAGNYFFRAIMLDKMKQLEPAKESYQKFLSLSQGKNPDQEFQARQRIRLLERELSKR